MEMVEWEPGTGREGSKPGTNGSKDRHVSPNRCASLLSVLSWLPAMLKCEQVLRDNVTILCEN